MSIAASMALLYSTAAAAMASAFAFPTSPASLIPSIRVLNIARAGGSWRLTAASPAAAISHPLTFSAMVASADKASAVASDAVPFATATSSFAFSSRAASSVLAPGSAALMPFSSMKDSPAWIRSTSRCV